MTVAHWCQPYMHPITVDALVGSGHKSTDPLKSQRSLPCTLNTDACIFAMYTQHRRLYLCHVHSTQTPVSLPCTLNTDACIFAMYTQHRRLYLCHVHSTQTPVSLPCTSVSGDGYTVHSCPPPLSPGDTRGPLGGPRSRCLRPVVRRTLDGAAAHHRPDSAERPEGLDGRHGVHRWGGLLCVAFPSGNGTAAARSSEPARNVVGLFGFQGGVRVSRRAQLGLPA